MVHEIAVQMSRSAQMLQREYSHNSQVNFCAYIGLYVYKTVS